MSCVVDGKIINSEITKNAKGGTELMRFRLLDVVDIKMLEGVAIHFSRVEKIYVNKINILYVHDLPEDQMYKNIMSEKYINYIDMFVFVSYHQRDLFIVKYNIPYSKCRVIPNTIGSDVFNISEKTNEDGKTRFIYHTTPHRGLELLYPVMEQLSKDYNIHLDVYSSFKVYGWETEDQRYKELFEKIKEHKDMTYHGTVSNAEVIEALRKSDIFLYPCIWHETSCLALIEAIQNGCICIHPDYGALPETAKGMTYMFPMTEDKNELANKSYRITKYILDNYDVVKQDVLNRTKNLCPYSLDDFSAQWNDVLKCVKDKKL